MRKLLLMAAMLLALVSCSDDLYNPGDKNPGTGGNLSLRLNIPASRVEGEYNVVYPGSQLECHVNDLRIFGFPVNGNGTFFTEQLEPGGADFPTDEEYRNYNMEITPGIYRVYVVANMGAAVEEIETEDSLKDVIINYKESLPEAGFIPMVYEPRESLTVDSENTVCVADMQFTCVKVDLNLIFDRTTGETGSAFGENGLKIKAVNGHNVSEKTWLVWGGSFAADNRRGSMEKNGITTGEYYNEWLDEPENEKISGKRIITPQTGGYDADKWLYHATLYLPERYVDSNDKQSRLTVDAVLTDASGMETDINTHYEIPLGHVPDNGDETAVRVLPRSTYYEIVGRIRSLGDIDLNLFVKVEPWTPLDLVADFLHTTLAVSRTEVKVSSVDTDYITYETNAPTVTFGWNAEDEIDGESLIVEAYHDRTNRTIGFRVNPKIPIGRFGNGEGLIPNTGTSKVYIKAGNIVKYINVTYEVHPFFEVTPLEETIQWSVGEGAKLSRYISFVTNLGGVIVSDENGNDRIISGNGYIDNNGSSNLRIKCDSTAYPKARIQVTATTDPVTTTEHRFIVRPVLEQYRDSAKTVIIRVRPEYTDYRIYFRAINDRQGEYSNNSGRYCSEYLTETLNPNTHLYESQTNNWIDGWSNEMFSEYQLFGPWPGKELTETVTLNGKKYYEMTLDNDAFVIFTNIESKTRDISVSEFSSAQTRAVRVWVTDNSTATSSGVQIGFEAVDFGDDIPSGKIKIYFENRFWVNDNTKIYCYSWKRFTTENGDPNRHRIYMYYQYGETGGSVPKDQVWYFNGNYPGKIMEPDSNNSGWFYYDIQTGAVAKNNYGKPDHPIKPGETLMIFNCGDDAVRVHRCPHHMDPGLSLFDFEDKEGWILYDPTSDPYYRVYDSKPEVIDVAYTIYTKEKVTGWYKLYGQNQFNSTKPGQFKIYRNACSPGIFTCDYASGWYKTVIVLKAVRGECEKGITLNLSSGGSLIMFDGNNYERSNHNGYYDGSWHQGKPSDVN